MKYSNTILGAIVAVIGLGLAAVYFLPDTKTGTLIMIGLIVLVVNTLLGTRQAEANGHRLNVVETLADVNTARLDATPGAPTAAVVNNNGTGGTSS